MIKTEGIGVMEDTADNDTVSTAELTALESDEEASDSLNKDEGTEENRPRKGPETILCGRDGTSTRALAIKEESAMMRATGRKGKTEERKGVTRKCP